jgi:hypothetical protein
MFSRIDADERGGDSLLHLLRGEAHRGDGAACPQFHYRQLGRGFRQFFEPSAKSLVLRLRAVAEPRPVAEHQALMLGDLDLTIIPAGEHVDAGELKRDLGFGAMGC